MRTKVYCTFQREKLHRWDEAGRFEEVSYLQYLHRHVFHYRVEVSVDGDREIEFIMLKHRLEKFVDSWGEIVGSCESQAILILEFLRASYPGRVYRVEVSEDGENGAIVEDEDN